MSKVAIVADIHFGVQGKLKDSLWAVRTVREYCKNTGIDTVIVLGDLFHDRKALEIDILTATCQFFIETHDTYGQQWIAFPGNHDMFLRHSWEINSLQIMQKYLTIINDVKLLTLDDKRFWVLPFITYEKPYMKVLEKINDQHEDGDILLTHIGVRGASLNTCFLLKDWSIVNFENSKFQKIYTGHFHSKQQIENVWYPGSLIPFKFDEGDVPHGFFVHNLEDNTHKFINIWKAGEKLFPNETPPPQFYNFIDTNLDEKTEADVKNNMIRIALTRDYSNDEKSEIRKKFTEMGAIAVRFFYINQHDQQPEIQKPEILKPNTNFFRDWLETDKPDIKGLDKSLLIQLEKDVRYEGDELYSVEESEDD